MVVVFSQGRYIEGMTPAQCRAARALLDWSQDVLAGNASVSVTTLRNFERGATVPVANNLAAIQRALEAAGVEFTNGDEPGVKLAKRKPKARKP